MKKILLVFFIVTFQLISANEVDLFIDISIDTPNFFDARNYYSELNYSDIEGEKYVDEKYFFLNQLDELDQIDIAFLTGTWTLNYFGNRDLYSFVDYISCYRTIIFHDDLNLGQSFSFWGSCSSKKAYKKDDFIVSTIGIMGRIGPILRYEFQNEKMYLYILNMDKWELADFHEGGKNYFIKTSPTHTPQTP